MATCSTKRRFLPKMAVCVLTAVALSLPTSASATLITADTDNAMPGYYGTKSIHFYEESNQMTVDGSIDYAVYAPQQFNVSFPGKDPSNGTQYVYRYQLYNNAATSHDYMLSLTVGLPGFTGDATYCKWVEPGPIYPDGGLAPGSRNKLIGTPPTSALFEYRGSAPLQPGNFSKMLIFTSDYPPTYRFASVVSSCSIQRWVDEDGNQYNWWEGQVPSPVPEPASLIGLLVFGACALAYRALSRN
jgi:hypothetical protein